MTPEYIRAESVRPGDVLDLGGERVTVEALEFGCCQRPGKMAQTPTGDCAACRREPVWFYTDAGRTFARVVSDMVQIVTRAGA